MSKSVSFTLNSERLVRIGEEQFILPVHSVLAGRLSLKTSDGPMGLREFEQPSFLHACFDFEFGGRQMRYAGFIRWSALWAPDGTQTTFEDRDFIPECGIIEGLKDSRADWFYISSDGRRHTNRLKYTGCYFEVMLKMTGMQVKCRYYDQNPDITGYVTIYYSRDLDDLLLRKDIKFCYDQDGKVEEFLWDEGPYVTLVEPCVPGTSKMRSRRSLKPIRFEGELLPDWAQLFDLAASLSSVPASTRQWFSVFTRQSGVDDARTIVDHCCALRSALHTRRESVLSALTPGSGDSPPATIHAGWLYALDTMVERASDAQTCSWEVEGADDNPGGFDSGGDITLRRV